MLKGSAAPKRFFIDESPSFFIEAPGIAGGEGFDAPLKSFWKDASASRLSVPIVLDLRLKGVAGVRIYSDPRIFRFVSCFRSSRVAT